MSDLPDLTPEQRTAVERLAAATVTLLEAFMRQTLEVQQEILRAGRKELQ